MTAHRLSLAIRLLADAVARCGRRRGARRPVPGRREGQRCRNDGAHLGRGHRARHWIQQGLQARGAAARERTVVFEHQENERKTARVWDDSAIVTALLWLKGGGPDGPFGYKLWFSDTYVRRSGGWRCVFGSASPRLPP